MPLESKDLLALQVSLATEDHLDQMVSQVGLDSLVPLALLDQLVTKVCWVTLDLQEILVQMESLVQWVL